MEIIALLLVAGVIILLLTPIYLVIRIRRLDHEVESQNRWLSRLEVELIRLKQRAEPPAPPTPPSEGVIMPAVRQPPPPPVPPEHVAPIAPVVSPVTKPVGVPSIAPPQSIPKATPIGKPKRIDWEQFMGVKMLAWVSGLAAFLAVAFFIKYSFERDLIPPEARLALSFLCGIGLVVGGVLVRRKAYMVTSHTLCATGVVVLYAASFASHGHYHLIDSEVAFGLMVLVTVTAFVLAVRMDAMVVAILGLLGGFLTPPLLSTGQDNPLGLFGYITILDIGLVAVGLRRRWHFLIALGAAGTALMQLAWAGKFFEASKVYTAQRVFLGMDLLFLGAFVAAQRLKQVNRWLSGSAIALPFVTLAFTFWLLGNRSVASQPGVVFTFLFGADLILLTLVFLRHELRQAHVVGGGVVFVFLMFWTAEYVKTPMLNWALAGYVAFAALHTAFPVVLDRLRPGLAPVWWGLLFPPLALVLTLIPLLRELTVPWLIWPVVLLIDVLAIGLALLTASLVAVIVVLLLSLAVAAAWIVQVPAQAAGLPPILIVVGAMALFFVAAGFFLSGKVLKRLEAAEGKETQGQAGANLPSFLRPWGGPDEIRAQIPAVAAIMPFVLLIMVVMRLPLPDPSPVYGLALLLLVLALGTAKLTKVDALVPVSLVSVLALESVWFQARFNALTPAIPLAWNLLFAAVFVIYPFLFRGALTGRVIPWACSAISGPLHFYIIYRVVERGYPNEFMGVLPAALAAPMVICLWVLARTVAADAPVRNTLLAWFGGSALFFITLIFPIQFEKQWITLGWALEGAALLWFFHRVPHPGLRGLGVILLVIAFARLSPLNQALWTYHERSGARILNWYLYSHGITTVALFLGARLLARPRHLVWGINVPPVLYTLSTVLAFVLLNIEIADYFSTGTRLTFQFGASFAQDMTYSLAWALFALALVSVGVWKGLAPVRYAGLALLGVTLLKLFFHDLVRLSALYRVGAFLGVAVITIVASILYQRFFSTRPSATGAPQNTEQDDHDSQIP